MNRPKDPDYIDDIELLALYACAHGDLPVSQDSDGDWYMFSEDSDSEPEEPDLWCNSYENGIPKLTEDMRREIRDAL